jgi:pre-rRNA-processing protein TSR1
MFPDEEDTPLDTPARQRYIKYRGLESFRRSVWENPDADLPPYYQKLFRFADFKKSRKLALNHAREGENVPLRVSLLCVLYFYWSRRYEHRLWM